MLVNSFVIEYRLAEIGLATNTAVRWGKLKGGSYVLTTRVGPSDKAPLIGRPVDNEPAWAHVITLDGPKCIIHSVYTSFPLFPLSHLAQKSVRGKGWQSVVDGDPHNPFKREPFGQGFIPITKEILFVLFLKRPVSTSPLATHIQSSPILHFFLLNFPPFFIPGKNNSQLLWLKTLWINSFLRYNFNLQTKLILIFNIR